MSTLNQKQDGLSFEEAMERLEEIVSSMEGERLPLEDMVQSYEEGAKLLRQCRDRIDLARQRVDLITANLEGNGKAALAPFDPAATEADPSPSTTSTTPPQRSASTASSRRKTTTDDDEDIRLF